MVNWWQSVIYGHRLSDRSVEKLENLESEIQQVDQQTKSILENLGVVSRNFTKAQVLLSCLIAFSLFLNIAYSGVVLFKTALWVFVTLLVLLYLFRRAYVSLVWYNIRRCRLKLAKLKTKKVYLLEELKQKNDFYKVFDVLKRFDENYKSLQGKSDTQQNNTLVEETTSAFSEIQLQERESSKSTSTTPTQYGAPHSSSTEISRSSSSQDGSNAAVEHNLESSWKKNPIQENSFKQRGKVNFQEKQASSFQTILPTWLNSIVHWIIFGLSGEHNLQLEEQLEVLRETLEIERTKRKKLEAELTRIIMNRNLIGSEETLEISNQTTVSRPSDSETS